MTIPSVHAMKDRISLLTGGAAVGRHVAGHVSLANMNDSNRSITSWGRVLWPEHHVQTLVDRHRPWGEVVGQDALQRHTWLPLVMAAVMATATSIRGKACCKHGI